MDKKSPYFAADNEIKRIPMQRKGFAVSQRGVPIISQENVSKGFDTVGAAAGTLAAGSALLPALAPVAAGLSVGYGIYKLGQSFNVW